MRRHRIAILALLAASALALGGCSGSDGKDGATGATGDTGPAGTPGTPGAPGLSCWDLNGNGVADVPLEDTNKDGTVNVDDCRTPSGAYDPVGLHKGYFTENTYTGTKQCLYCHGKTGDDVMKTAHWKWEGTVTGIAGFEGTTHGKKDLINNFCQAVPGNEGRCSQCHIGYGWKDKTFNFSDPKNIDCLACHDQTGTYKKVQAPSAAQPVAGGPEPSVDLQKVAQSVAINGGVPRRAACVFCHSRAGGDDNVKHGDISTRFGLTATDGTDPFDRTEDVHMGVDGGNMTCVACHQVKKDLAGNQLDHGIGGFMFHSSDEGALKDCGDCHGSAAGIHAGTSVERAVRTHTRLACQACHIPAIARKVSTYTDWRWGLAGSDTRPEACAASPLGTGADGQTNRGTYSKLKGCFTWGTAVRPTLRFYNGKWNRVITGYNDKYTTLPMDLGSPTATYLDADAMIYPFKKMTGNQAFDKNNKTVLVPHLWGTVTGPNPYWSFFNWDLALSDNSAYLPAYNAGAQIYTGQYEFLDTVMLLKVDHEIPPASQALGMGDANGCVDCHLSGQIDWPALGWSGDPASGGKRPAP